jgi:hypothetical protein
MEVHMHIGSVLLLLWLIVGVVAAGQRGYWHDDPLGSCSKAGTTGVTVLAGPLNYTGVDPHISCNTVKPSN